MPGNQSIMDGGESNHLLLLASGSLSFHPHDSPVASSSRRYYSNRNNNSSFPPSRLMSCRAFLRVIRNACVSLLTNPSCPTTIPSSLPIINAPTIPTAGMGTRQDNNKGQFCSSGDILIFHVRRSSSSEGVLLLFNAQLQLLSASHVKCIYASSCPLLKALYYVRGRSLLQHHAAAATDEVRLIRSERVGGGGGN